MTSERNLQWVDEVIADLEAVLEVLKARRGDQAQEARDARTD